MSGCTCLRPGPTRSRPRRHAATSRRRSPRTCAGSSTTHRDGPPNAVSDLQETGRMPRFCANLSMMFLESPLRERFAAARQAGFPGVELQFPYEMQADDMAHLARLAHVEVVNFNTAIGDRAAGEVGIACLQIGRAHV